MKEFENAKHIHMTAICGTAMGALAGMLIQKGYKVTGSDHGVYPPMSTYLQNLGVNIMEGFKPENLDVAPDVVIIGNTVKKDNPEAQEIIKRGLPYLHLPHALSEYFLKDKHPIVIAGTHGKTTTTALCTWVFESAGLDPGFLVGGILKNFNSNNRVGQGGHFVIEGDEYDSAYFDKVPKMWYYRPQTAAITSVEFDHGDIYRDIDHIKEAFAKFVCMIPPTGYLVACADYDNVLQVIDVAVCDVLTYGFSDRAQMKVTDVKMDEEGTTFTLIKDGEKVCTLRSPLWGRHNALNTAAVTAVAMHHGITIEQIQHALDTFEGVKRRQEIFHNENGVVVIDDFAHHPTKVRETVNAVRFRYPKRRLIAVYEPRTNTSRRNFFQDIYPAAFDSADMAIIAKVYNLHQIEPGKAMNPEKMVEDINKRGVKAIQLPGADEIVEYLGGEVKTGDVILIMSNGGFGGIYAKLPDRLRKNYITPMPRMA